MNNKIILCDMDGVLADFLYGLLNEHNREDLIDKYDAGTFPLDWMLEGELGSEDDIWGPVKKLGLPFWKNLPAYKWAEDVIKIVKDTGCKWYICTTPFYQSDCYKGKVEWIHNFLGEDFKDIIMLKDKWLLANENTYLIDDSQDNYDKFIAHGGNGFLFPQSWNRGRKALNSRLPLLRYHINAFIEDLTSDKKREAVYVRN